MEEKDLNSAATQFLNDENYNVNDKVKFLLENIWANIKNDSNFDLKEFIKFCNIFGKNSKIINETFSNLFNLINKLFEKVIQFISINESIFIGNFFYVLLKCHLENKNIKKINKQIFSEKINYNSIKLTNEEIMKKIKLISILIKYIIFFNFCIINVNEFELTNQLKITEIFEEFLKNFSFEKNQSNLFISYYVKKQIYKLFNRRGIYKKANLLILKKFFSEIIFNEDKFLLYELLNFTTRKKYVDELFSLKLNEENNWYFEKDKSKICVYLNHVKLKNLFDNFNFNIQIIKQIKKNYLYLEKLNNIINFSDLKFDKNNFTKFLYIDIIIKKNFSINNINKRIFLTDFKNNFDNYTKKDSNKINEKFYRDYFFYNLFANDFIIMNNLIKEKIEINLIKTNEKKTIIFNYFNNNIFKIVNEYFLHKENNNDNKIEIDEFNNKKLKLNLNQILLILILLHQKYISLKNSEINEKNSIKIQINKIFYFISNNLFVYFNEKKNKNSIKFNSIIANFVLETFNEFKITFFKNGIQKEFFNEKFQNYENNIKLQIHSKIFYYIPYYINYMILNNFESNKFLEELNNYFKLIIFYIDNIKENKLSETLNVKKLYNLIYFYINIIKKIFYFEYSKKNNQNIFYENKIFFPYCLNCNHKLKKNKIFFGKFLIQCNLCEKFMNLIFFDKNYFMNKNFVNDIFQMKFSLILNEITNFFCFENENVKFNEKINVDHYFILKILYLIIKNFCVINLINENKFEIFFNNSNDSNELKEKLCKIYFFYCFFPIENLKKNDVINENKIFNYSIKDKKLNKIKNELKLIKFRKKMNIILNFNNLINDFIQNK